MEHELDNYANSFLDGINWRMEAAQLHIKYGQNESSACGFMKEKLLEYLVKKHGVDLSTHDIALNGTTRKFSVIPRGN